MLDPALKLSNKQAIAHKKAEIADMMQRLNASSAFPSMFATLWYSTLPCFDIRNITIGAIQIIRDTSGGRGGYQKCHTTIFIGNFPSKG
jgi:hypothetical protein